MSNAKTGTLWVDANLAGILGVREDGATLTVGAVTLTMPAASTAGLAHRPAPWRWDLQVTDPDGVVLTLLRGRVVVLPQVTT